MERYTSVSVDGSQSKTRKYVEIQRKPTQVPFFFNHDNSLRIRKNGISGGP